MNILMLMSSFNLMFSFMFVIMRHPLSMGVILLIQTTLISLITSMINMTTWFSYMMFMIMAGGMLVMFIYMTNTASNELMSFSINLLLTTIFTMNILMIFYFTFDTMIFFPFNSYKLIDLTNKINMNFTYSSLMPLFNYPNINISFFIINYLLITLIISVKIIETNKGPLKSN